MAEIQRDLQILQIISQLGPEAVAQINISALARKILRDGDMSPEVILDEQQVQEKVQAQQQQQLLQQATESIQQQPTGQTVPPTGPAPVI